MCSLCAIYRRYIDGKQAWVLQRNQYLCDHKAFSDLRSLALHRVRPKSDGFIRADRQRVYCAFAKLAYFLCAPASKYVKNRGDGNFELPGHQIWREHLGV